MSTLASNLAAPRATAIRPPRMARRLPGVRRAATYLIHRIADRIAASLDYRGRVIDLGCGIAPYKSMILAQADEYVGVDWRHSPHGDAQVDICADLTRPLPLAEAQADTVVSFQVMEHLPEPARFLRECHRLLRPGGRVHLTVPFMWHVHEAPHDYFRYTRHGLEHLLTKAGFTDIRIEAYGGFWTTWVLKFNYHTLRRTRGAGIVLAVALVPVWLLGQWLAPMLDRLEPRADEATGYIASATKPGPHAIS
jgi:SAM-dependent methyltransferase